MGHEFTSLILALLHVGGHPPKEDAELPDAVRTLEGDFVFETFFSLSCQNCPDVVQELNIMAALNSNIRHTAIDGALFQDEVERRTVMAVDWKSDGWGKGGYVGVVYGWCGTIKKKN